MDYRYPKRLCATTHELAEDLGVTPAVLRDRMRWLTEEEEEQVWESLYVDSGEC